MSNNSNIWRQRCAAALVAAQEAELQAEAFANDPDQRRARIAELRLSEEQSRLARMRLELQLAVERDAAALAGVTSAV